jgi:hypothetical protein
MKNQRKVELQTSRSAQEVLHQITTATEREVLPFISASRYPQRRDKEFVSKISGYRFRVWKVPSSSRSKQNICSPYLHGTVTEIDGGSSLSASFALHPFNKLLPFLPLLILVPAWLWGPKTTQSLIFLSGFSVLFLIIEVMMIRAVLRMLPKEKGDIIQFLLDLFPESHLKGTLKKP